MSFKTKNDKEIEKLHNLMENTANGEDKARLEERIAEKLLQKQ